MEYYHSVETQASKEFQKLLENSFSKNSNLIEGNIIKATIVHVGEKIALLECPGLKSEAILELGELKNSGMLEKAKVGSKIDVVLETIESKDGQVIVSASKAKKINGYNAILKSYENNENIDVTIHSKMKGGLIATHVDTGFLCFMPGSQLNFSPIKDISHLMSTKFKVKIIKVDKARGNVVVSRKEALSETNKESRQNILKKFNIGDRVKGVVKDNSSSFGVFFEIKTEDGMIIDSLCHNSEISHERVENPKNLVNIGSEHLLEIIGKDEDKGQISTSLKKCFPDPFDSIAHELKVGQVCDVSITKIIEWGFFATIGKSSLNALCHNSNMSWTQKNPSPKKLYKVGQIVKARIEEINIPDKKISISTRACIENVFEKIEKEKKIGDILDCTIASISDTYAMASIDGYDNCLGFLHASQLSYFSDNHAEELKKLSIGKKIKLKLIELNSKEMKLKLSLKMCEPDPWEVIVKKKLKENSIITVKVISIQKNGLLVELEGSKVTTFIKKSEIAINANDARPTRWNPMDRLDAACKTINHDKKKIELSIRLLETIEKKIALDKYGAKEGSGKSLPFQSLASDMVKSQNLKKKKKEKKD